MQMSGDEGISAFPKDDNLFEWLGTIHGSTGTVYEGVEYKISLKFGPKYPNEPPQVQSRACLHAAPAPAQPHALALLQCKFTTRVFHPNVDAQSGNICLDILTTDKWSAVLDVCRSQPRAAVHFNDALRRSGRCLSRCAHCCRSPTTTRR